jgi:DNA-binding CsgD family transcriptional regulator/PAS domain-containing protein
LASAWEHLDRAFATETDVEALARAAESMALRVAVWRLVDGEILLAYANRAYRESSALKQGEAIIGLPLGEIVTEGVQRRARRAIVAAAGGEVQHIERVIEDSLGRTRIERMTIGPLRESPVPEVLAIAVDVTAELHDTPPAAPGPTRAGAAEVDFRLLFHDIPAPIGVWRLDRDDAILGYANRAYVELWSELTTDPILGRSLRRDFAIPGAPAPSQALAAIRAGEPVKLEAPLRDASGSERVLIVNLQPFGAPSPTHFVSALIDVTESRRLEREIEAARERAATSQEGSTWGLTPRQLEVLRLIATGLSNAEIAERLGVARETVKWHSKEILRRTGAHTRAEAVAMLLSAPR